MKKENRYTAYSKKTYKRIELKLRKDSEADLIDFLSEQENIQKYLKDLIRDEMKREVK